MTDVSYSYPLVPDLYSLSQNPWFPTRNAAVYGLSSFRARGIRDFKLMLNEPVFLGHWLAILTPVPKKGVVLAPFPTRIRRVFDFESFDRGFSKGSGRRP